jgi:hypothetical protein
MTKRSNDDLSVADTSGLTDGDWAEINRLKRAYADGGDKAFRRLQVSLGRKRRGQL